MMNETKGEMQVKVVSWNCLKKFKNKRKVIEEFEADLYIISESENPELLGPDFTENKVFYQYEAYENDKLGLLVYSKKYEITLNQKLDLKMRYFINFSCNGQDFLAVWTKDYYIFDILPYCIANEAYIKNAIIMGDFNGNAKTYKDYLIDNVRGFKGLYEWLQERDYISCYHDKTGDVPGEEKQHTHLNNRGGKKHIDYCFVKKSLNYKEFEIASQWTDDKIDANELKADHFPLVLEF